MSANYSVISPRTFEEWPEDHPGRNLPVMPAEHLAMADVVVCSIKGEYRLPPAPDDADDEALCHKCEATVVHRRSAPALPKECWKCFNGTP